MGQTGSSDQRNAISAILLTKISQPCDDEADTKANTILAMRNFCQIFPSEVTQIDQYAIQLIRI